MCHEHKYFENLENGMLLFNLSRIFYLSLVHSLSVDGTKIELKFKSVLKFAPQTFITYVLQARARNRQIQRSS